MHPARKPWWQQATALVTVSTSGAITGFSFVPGHAATMTTPSSVPLHLLALEQAAAHPGDVANARAVNAGSAGSTADDTLLRTAIVNVARYYLGLAQTRTPAQMETLIWENTSTNGASHGPSGAAFASLALELAAQAVGQRSWATGGGSYPWPLPDWADVRVNPNPDSPGIISIVTDARSHGRWHPLGDGYAPQPGDWVVFRGNVQVVTGSSGGTLTAIGADSGPALTVAEHSFTGPLAGSGIEGFVDNGHLPPGTGEHAVAGGHGSDHGSDHGSAVIPGVIPAARAAAAPGTPQPSSTQPSSTQPSATRPATTPEKGATRPYRQHTAPSPAPAPASTAPPGTRAQQAFIALVAPGAMASQQRYGVPAAVTIAQAIQESGWGHSELAARYHNLFGIKGTGPAGSVLMKTSEYEGGHWVTVNASFRVYHNVAESIADHAELLATSDYYQRAMADRAVPDAFANDLTGVYATDPEYGSNLIALMRLYNLYRFDTATGSGPAVPARPRAAHAAPSPAAPGPAAPGHGAGQAVIPGLVTPPAAARVTRAARYQPAMPAAVTTAFFTTAKAPLKHAEHLYREVAAGAGIRWELLAACDWMQCKAHPRYSPVHGEKLGTLNSDGTSYATKSQALAQCASDLVALGAAVYRIDLTAPGPLSLRALAEAFAAFRWGGLLRRHRVSAFEFPYSVAGLTGQHTKMHWPAIDAPDAPDRPGARYRDPFGAVPVVLSLGYPATELSPTRIPGKPYEAEPTAR